MREMSNLDVYFAARELKMLEGGRIDKIYREGKKVWMRIYLPEKGERDLVFFPGAIFLSEYKRYAEREPDSFCMLLRKHLLGKRILFVKQKGFERIVEIETRESILVFEIFSKGNVILCDKNYTIIMPMEVQLWRDREILPKKAYKYPPSPLNPFSLSFEEFCEILKGNKKIVSFLAANLYFSGFYAEEICARAGIDKNKKVSELSEEERKRIFEVIRKLRQEFSPVLYVKDSLPENFAPFEMLTLKDKFEERKFDTFCRVLDEYFTHREREATRSESEERARSERERIRRIIERQKDVLKNLERMEEESRKKAEILFNHLDLVERIFSGLRNALAKGMGWEKIREVVELEDSEEARAIREIREHEGKLILYLEGREIEVDFTLSPAENAQEYYERAKKYRRKIESVKERIEQMKKEAKKVEKGEEGKSAGERIRKRGERERKHWYERFRWSFTSEGFLVVAGKDAAQNELLYSKYLEPSDVVLHADIAGAPLTVVKSQGREITPLAVREAAEIAATYSRAWKMQLGSVDVYWVLPEQVSKSPPPGQYLPKGSFMIYGQKNYLRKTQVRICIGVTIDEEKQEARVYTGSVLGARKYCKYFVTVYPGSIPKIKAGREVKLKLLQKALPEDKAPIEKIPEEEFISALPGDCGEIIG